MAKVTCVVGVERNQCVIVIYSVFTLLDFLVVLMLLLSGNGRTGGVNKLAGV